jgi:hypothetical protein
MPYWVEFKPEYGLHAGPVWPTPYSHGCIRLHPNAAPKFFALVHSGTSVDIAQSQPEDQTIGRKVIHCKSGCSEVLVIVDAKQGTAGTPRERSAATRKRGSSETVGPEILL